MDIGGKAPRKLNVGSSPEKYFANLLTRGSNQ
jgi:hypothetical protein